MISLLRKYLKFNFSFLPQFIIWLNKVKTLLKVCNDSMCYQHQIIDEQYFADEKRTIFKVRSIGMNIYPRYSADELANDDEILKNFHPIDIKRIMRAYFSDNEIYCIENIKYKISSKAKINDVFLFTLVSCIDSSHFKKMTSSEIVNNKDILFSLSKDDISDICINAGIEHVLNEKYIINSMVKSQIINFSDIKKNNS